ncbi:MAG: IclR family transcriptional regulator [Thermodesulfobacteriota bacterium]
MKNYTVHSLERGLDLLELLAEGPPEKALSQISQAAGFNPTTAHRILKALKSRGYVQQNPATSDYGLTLKLFELGQKAIRHVNFREQAVIVLRNIARRTGETAYLFIRDGDEAICLERIEGSNFVKVFFVEVGDRRPLYVGAAARVLLAYQREEVIERVIDRFSQDHSDEGLWGEPEVLRDALKQIREQGYSLNFYPATGAAALGCPVRSYAGEVVASISISGVTDHFAPDKLPYLVEILKEETSGLRGRVEAKAMKKSLSP